MDNTDTQYIGKYEVIATLGRGSMGVVYKARDPEIGRIVAIKTLRSIFMGDDAEGSEALKRFRQESRSAGRLHHPNIVTIFEAGRTDTGSPYIVMEYVDGPSLESINGQRAPLDPLEVLHYLAQVAAAIDYAHRQNVIHRDIKPSNIIVDPFFRPQLLDFGVAKLSDTSLTPAGTVVGTPSYMSPEQIRGETLDGATDRFAFAVVAFELFTGVRPFPGQDFSTVVCNIINKEPLSLAQANASHLPSQVEGILVRGLAKGRKDRYLTALELVDALAKAFGATIDGMGLVGGYNPQMKWQPRKEQPISSPVLAAQGSDVASGANFRLGNEVSAANRFVGQEDAVSRAKAVDPTIRERRPGSGVFRKIAILVLVIVLIAGASALAIDRLPIDNLLATLTRGDATKPETGEVSDSKVSTASERVAAVPLVLNKAPVDSKTADSLTTAPEVVVDNRATVEPKTVQLETAHSTTVEAKTVEPTIVEPKTVEPKTVETKTVEPRTEVDVVALSEVDLQTFLRTKTAAPVLLQAALVEVTRRADPVFVPAVAAAGEHDHFRVRVDVIKVLSKPPFNTRPEAVQAVVKLLEDSDPLVRGFAAKYLGPWAGIEGLKALGARASVETDERVLIPMRQSLALYDAELKKK